jgi:hypothetical protein
MNVGSALSVKLGVSVGRAEGSGVGALVGGYNSAVQVAMPAL